MIKKYTINNWIFRILAPIFFGLLVYVLILLFFDSINQLSAHFINTEYLVCLILCTFISESLRIVFNIYRKRSKLNLTKLIATQAIITISASIIITLVFISLYFKYMVGLFTFKAELTIFTALAILIAIFYNMIHLGEFLQEYNSQSIIEQHKQLKQEAQDKWKTFQDKINPELLYKSLEHIIGLVKVNKNKADEFIKKLAELYRQILGTNEEFHTAENELNCLKHFISIIDNSFYGFIEISVESKELPNNNHILSGLLLQSLQEIIEANITSPLQPLKISISTSKKSISIQYRENKKLNATKNLDKWLNTINKKLNWYTKSTIQANKENSIRIIEIPFITIDN